MYSDPDFPDIRDLLSISDMVSNNVHYLAQIESPHAPDGPWGAVMPPASSDAPTEAVAPGGIVAPVARKSRKIAPTVAFAAIPPSVRKAYTRLRKHDIFSVTGPVYRVAPEYRNTALAEGWETCIETVTVSTMAAVLDEDTAVELSIPLSPVEHDNAMLVIGNVSRTTGAMPGECTEGENCEALMFTGNIQKLQPYYTPSQWTAFHQHGSVIRGRCLLCIRKIITNVVHLYNQQCLGVMAHNQLPATVPFYNSVNAPGGYRVECTISPSAIMFLQGHVAAYQPELLHFVPTSITADGIQCGYFNQSCLIWQNTPEASN